MKATNLIGLCQKKRPGDFLSPGGFAWDPATGWNEIRMVRGTSGEGMPGPHFLRRWAALMRQIKKALFSEHFVSLRLRPKAGNTPREGTYRDQA